MNPSKHTPGPWELGFQNNQTIYSGANEIATVACRQKECKANARLIASAPDLFNACRVVKELLEYRQDAYEFAGSISLLKSILAKARGEL